MTEIQQAFDPSMPFRYLRDILNNRQDNERFKDMLEAIEGIQKVIIVGRNFFDGNQYKVVFLAHQLQIIGEASRTISRQIKAQYPEIPWLRLATLNKKLVHRYYEISDNELWQIATTELTPLKEAVIEILNSPKPKP